MAGRASRQRISPSPAWGKPAGVLLLECAIRRLVRLLAVRCRRVLGQVRARLLEHPLDLGLGPACPCRAPDAMETPPEALRISRRSQSRSRAHQPVPFAGWNGNVERPTLHPSILTDDVAGTATCGTAGWSAPDAPANATSDTQ